MIISDLKKNKIKIFFKVFLLLIIVLFFNKEVKSNTFLITSSNKNINKTVKLASIIKIQEEARILELNTPISTFIGELTGYSGDCPKCSGIVACKPRTNVLEKGIFFDDLEYGVVRMVASSRKYPCGSIIKFNKKSVSSDPIIAVVMDRGVGGNTIDLLVENASYAIKNVGRVKNIEFEVLRYGWK